MKSKRGNQNTIKADSELIQNSSSDSSDHESGEDLHEQKLSLHSTVITASDNSERSILDFMASFLNEVTEEIKEEKAALDSTGNNLPRTSDHTDTELPSQALQVTISPNLRGRTMGSPASILSLSPALSPQGHNTSALTVYMSPSQSSRSLGRPAEALSEESKTNPSLRIILPLNDPTLSWTLDLQPTTINPNDLNTAPNFESAPSPSPLPPEPISMETAQTAQKEEEQPETNPCKDRLKGIAYDLVLAILVLPNAVNAFCEPTGIKPADINADWWDELPVETQIHSIVNAICSLIVNVYVQRDYMPQAWAQLLESLRSIFKSTQDFLANLLALIASFAAAFSFAAISREASLWLGEIPSFLPALASLITSFATRFPSVKRVSGQLVLFFDSNMRFQKQMADRLLHLKPEHLRACNLIIRRKGYKLKDIALILNTIALHYEGLAPDLYLLEQTNLEYLKENSIKLTTISFAALIASTAIQTFTQKGFDGINAVFHLLRSSLNHLNNFIKFLIGMPGGFVSGMLYYDSGLRFIPTLVYVLSQLAQDSIHAFKNLVNRPKMTLRETYEDPEQLLLDIKLTIGLSLNLFASGAMKTVGVSIIANKQGIFRNSTLSWPPYASAFPDFNRLGGLALNTNSTVNQIRKKEIADRKNNPTLKEVITYLNENPLPSKMTISDNNQVVEVEPLSHLKKFSFFKITTAPAQVEMINLTPESNLDVFDPDESDSEGEEADETHPLLGRRRRTEGGRASFCTRARAACTLI